MPDESKEYARFIGMQDMGNGKSEPMFNLPSNGTTVTGEDAVRRAGYLVLGYEDKVKYTHE